MTLGRIFRRHQRSPENVKSAELIEQLRNEVKELVGKLETFSRDVQTELQDLESKNSRGE